MFWGVFIDHAQTMRSKQELQMIFLTKNAAQKYLRRYLIFDGLDKKAQIKRVSLRDVHAWKELVSNMLWNIEMERL